MEMSNNCVNSFMYLSRYNELLKLTTMNFSRCLIWAVLTGSCLTTLLRKIRVRLWKWWPDVMKQNHPAVLLLIPCVITRSVALTSYL